MPPVHGFPPNESNPLIQIDFRPLPMLPPMSAELLGIRGSCYRNRLCTELVPENTQRPASVVIGRDHKDSVHVPRSEAACCIACLGSGGESVDWTNGDGIFLRKLPHIILRYVQQRDVIDFGFRRNVQEHAWRVFL